MTETTSQSAGARAAAGALRSVRTLGAKGLRAVGPLAASVGRRANLLLDKDLTKAVPSIIDARAKGVPQTERFPAPPEEDLRPEIAPLVEAIGGHVRGRDQEVRLALACYLSGGHLLLDGPPGLGKTTLAQMLAAHLGRGLKRIQFTSDLMPADIL
ncbi:MAG: MoxR family ATPase, partial [Pseudomonadota bacterium]